MFEIKKRRLLISLLMLVVVLICFPKNIYYSNAEESNENISLLATETFPNIYYLNDTDKNKSIELYLRIYQNTKNATTSVIDEITPNIIINRLIDLISHFLTFLRNESSTLS